MQNWKWAPLSGSIKDFMECVCVARAPRDFEINVGLCILYAGGVSLFKILIKFKVKLKLEYAASCLLIVFIFTEFSLHFPYK